jgi:8-oxo-dGTP pyrophosphatase MutT (NUDIX family)
VRHLPSTSGERAVSRTSAPGPHADTTATLTAWRPTTPAQRSLREAFLGFLDARPDACARSCEPGHITASALVLDATGGQVLLTLHPRVGAWLQLGGHCEPSDTTLAGAALREATEESGIDGLVIEPVPVHVDVHPITCSLGVPTRHFDVRFLVHAPAGARPVRSDESLDLRWWPVDGLPTDPNGWSSGLAEMLAHSSR